MQKKIFGFNFSSTRLTWSKMSKICLSQSQAFILSARNQKSKSIKKKEKLIS